MVVVRGGGVELQDGRGSEKEQSTGGQLETAAPCLGDVGAVTEGLWRRSRSALVKGLGAGGSSAGGDWEGARVKRCLDATAAAEAST